MTISIDSTFIDFKGKISDSLAKMTKMPNWQVKLLEEIETMKDEIEEKWVNIILEFMKRNRGPELFEKFDYKKSSKKRKRVVYSRARKKGIKRKGLMEKMEEQNKGIEMNKKLMVLQPNSAFKEGEEKSLQSHFGLRRANSVMGGSMFRFKSVAAEKKQKPALETPYKGRHERKKTFIQMDSLLVTDPKGRSTNIRSTMYNNMSSSKLIKTKPANSSLIPKSYQADSVLIKPDNTTKESTNMINLEPEQKPTAQAQRDIFSLVSKKMSSLPTDINVIPPSPDKQQSQSSSKQDRKDFRL
jgi:hypothetical protein